MLLTKIFTFEAAHKLPNYDGKCKNLHGHTYTLEVTISGTINPQTGMVLDFGIVKQIVNQSVIDKLDHQYLNDIFDNPTAENMVKWIWDILNQEFERHSIRLHQLKLWETQTASVIYQGN